MSNDGASANLIPRLMDGSHGWQGAPSDVLREHHSSCVVSAARRGARAETTTSAFFAKPE